MVSPRPGALRVSALCALAVVLAAAYSGPSQATSPNIVISQVYGAGGNSGATLTHDYIELFNRGNTAVSLAGWSLQYASASGTGNFGATATQITELPNVTLNPGQYYLVQEAGGSTGSAMPAADFIDPTPIAMAAGAGKVALASSATTLGCNGGSNACSPAQLASIVDLVGYGSANFFEGAGPTATLSATLAAFRGDGGCIDTDQNSTDFAVATPAPRNMAAALRPCEGPPPGVSLSINDVTVTEGNSGATPATFTVSLNGPAPAAGVSFTIATADGTATVADGDYVVNGPLVQTIPAGSTSFTFTVDVNGDTTVEPTETFVVNITSVTGADVVDNQGTGTITGDDFSIVTHDLVISQVYGGGGNTNAPFTHDFIEIFNREATSVNVSGWTVQYASASGTTWAETPLTGTIGPGRYLLVRLAGGATGVALPAADVTGSTNLSGTNGKVALVAASAQLTGACPAGGAIVDLVGYGAASCAETAPASATSNTLAALRKRAGCFDSNNNSVDFGLGTPDPRNSATAARSCEFTSLAIHDIQGSELFTTRGGQSVTTTGIVTAIKNNGFFIQTPAADADSDPSTSQGLFVFTGTSPAVTVGDVVSARGSATEFFSLTQLESSLPGDITVTSSGGTLPPAVELTTTVLTTGGGVTQLERFEGMRVHADTVISVAPTDEFGEIYTVLPGVARPMREPGIDITMPVPPDPNTGEIKSSTIPRWDRNPERLVLDTDGLRGATRLQVTSNTTLSNVGGALDFSFGDYKILPDVQPVTGSGMAVTSVPAAAANEFTVGSYNIENFTSGNNIQLAKAALAIRTVMRAPDVLGVIEVADLASLTSLANRINADAVAAGETDPDYAAYLIQAPAGGDQNVGFLVKQSRVTVQSVTQELGAMRFGTAFLHDRPPLVLHATVDASGSHSGPIIVVVNHMRSFIDVELVSAEGARVRAKRTAQAESIAELLDALQDDNPSTPVISVGDYNAFQFNDGYTDPISILKGTPRPGAQVVVGQSPDNVDPDFENLTDLLPVDQQYSFIFGGTPQALDHVLVNGVAKSLFQRYAIGRSNADFPQTTELLSDPTRPERSSDHDTPVAYFAFPGTPVVTLRGNATMQVEAFTSFVDPGADAHDDRGPLPVVATGTVDVMVPGTYTLTYTASNGFQTTSITRIVTVVDTKAPDINGFSLSLDSIGPPNHQMVDLSAFYTATDASGVAVCTLGVTSNESQNSLGDGNTAVDWQILDPRRLLLRAERSGRGDGRLYSVTVTCSDGAGNHSSATAVVTVQK